MKFDEIKKMSVWEILKLLQKKTRRNANLIKENSRMIQSVLNGDIELSNGKFNVAEVQAKNNELIQQNSEYLKLHNKLLSFMRSMQDATKVKNIEDLEGDFKIEVSETENVNESVDDIFNNTIRGEIAFDSKHPYRESEEFKERLLKYYTEHEEYEKCALIVSEKP